MNIRSPRRTTVLLGLLALSATSSPATADPPSERVGLGVAFSMPNPAVSLSGQFDERWSASLLVGYGTEVRVNRAIAELPGRYWTFGAGYMPDLDLGVVRAGYGREWRHGPWRWHLETTLNVPVYTSSDEDLNDIGRFIVSTYTVLVPIGFGVRYVFGER